jgi:hypothetical protein
MENELTGSILIETDKGIIIDNGIVTIDEDYKSHD